VFALVFQLVLILRGDSVLDEANAPGTPEAVRRYFFYFTIQSNALVAFTCWLVATRDIGSSRLLRHCALPVTARGVVKLVCTNLGVFEPAGEGFRVRELAPGVDLAAAQAATATPLYAG